MCTVQKGKRAPHRKAADDVYGAEWRISTAQENCRECVWCKRANKHRTGKLWRICTVQKGKRAPHRGVAEDIYGVERQKDEKTKRQKDKKTNNKHHTEFRKEKV